MITRAEVWRKCRVKFLYMRLRFQEERFRSSAINSKFQLDKFLFMLFAKSTVYFRWKSIFLPLYLPNISTYLFMRNHQLLTRWYHQLLDTLYAIAKYCSNAIACFIFNSLFVLLKQNGSYIKEKMLWIYHFLKKRKELLEQPNTYTCTWFLVLWKVIHGLISWNGWLQRPVCGLVKKQ